MIENLCKNTMDLTILIDGLLWLTGLFALQKTTSYKTCVYSFLSFLPNYITIGYPELKIWVEYGIFSQRFVTFHLELWPFTSIVLW